MSIASFQPEMSTVVLKSSRSSDTISVGRISMQEWKLHFSGKEVAFDAVIKTLPKAQWTQGMITLTYSTTLVQSRSFKKL